MTNPSNISSGESDERAAFENHLIETFGYGDLLRHDDGSYCITRINNDWMLWRAALATQPAPDEPVNICMTETGRKAIDAAADALSRAMAWGRFGTERELRIARALSGLRAMQALTDSKACASVGVDPVRAALSELVDSLAEQYPSSEQGKDAQDRWAERRDATLKNALTALASPAPSVGEPVAEIVECDVMGQQTVAEIDGRWKFLPLGTKLYTTPPVAPAATEAPSLNAEDFLDDGLADVQDEGGVLTYYSRSAVLECIQAALDATPAPAVGASLKDSLSFALVRAKVPNVYWKPFFDGLATELSAAESVQPVLASLSDTRRLDALRENSWDLRCIDVPTGGDDSDIHWRVVEHHMTEPHERDVGRCYRDEPRDAIDDALASSTPTKGGEAS